MTGSSSFTARFQPGTGVLDAILRRSIWRALAQRCGSGLVVSTGVGFRHAETFVIGADVFLGADAILQGHPDGRCRIGKQAWIGPQAFLDARDLVIGEAVGLGPGVRILRVRLPRSDYAASGMTPFA